MCRLSDVYHVGFFCLQKSESIVVLMFAENILRVRFETPETIPMVFHINPACWQHYPHDALQELVATHPLLFPDFAPLARVTPAFSPVQRRDTPYRDPWGCVWRAPRTASPAPSPSIRWPIGPRSRATTARPILT